MKSEKKEHIVQLIDTFVELRDGLTDEQTSAEYESLLRLVEAAWDDISTALDEA